MVKIICLSHTHPDQQKNLKCQTPKHLYAIYLIYPGSFKTKFKIRSGYKKILRNRSLKAFLNKFGQTPYKYKLEFSNIMKEISPKYDLLFM